MKLRAISDAALARLPHTLFARRRWLMSAALFAALSVIGYHWFAEQSHRARLSQEYATAEAWRQRYQVEVFFPESSQRPLEELLREFEHQTGIKVTANNDAQPRRLELPLGCQLPPLSAYDWLETATRLRAVEWEVTAAGEVRLVGLARNEPRYWLNYPLPEMPGRNPDRTAELVTSHVEPNQWEDTGGPWAIQSSPGGILTFQTHRGHLQTQRFLAALSKVHALATERAPLLGVSEAAGDPIWLDGEEQGFRELLAALERPISLQMEEGFFQELVEKLSAQAHVPIATHPELMLIKRTPATAGVGQEKLPAVPLGRFLKKWSGEDDLFFGLGARGQMLVIADRRDQAQLREFSPLTLCAYPVTDLIGSNEDGQVDKLVDLITSTLNPADWADVGGTAQIKHFSATLLISQTLDGHPRTIELLRKLRQVRGGSARHVALSPDPPLPKISPDVERRLNRPTKIVQTGTLIPTAVAEILQQAELRMSDFQVTNKGVWCHLPERPLRENLQLLFGVLDNDPLRFERFSEQQLDETYYDADLKVCEIFDLRPWLLTRHTALSVAHLVTHAVDGENWQDEGGNGSAQQFGDALVVQAHPRTMARVRLFLQALEEYTSSNRAQWRGQRMSGEILNRPLDLYGPTDAEAVRKKWIADRNAEIHKLLAQRVSVNLKNQPRMAVLHELAIKYDLPMVVRVSLVGPGFQGIIDDQNGEPLEIFATAPVSVVAEQIPLGELLQQLIGDPQKQQIVVQQGTIRIGKTSELQQRTRSQEDFLYCVDDLIAPRGELQPKQLLRTLMQAVLDHKAQRPASERPPPNTPDDLWMEFRFGNLLQVYHHNDPRSLAYVEQTLRELRSGERQPLPTAPGDSRFLQPAEAGFGTTPLDLFTPNGAP